MGNKANLNTNLEVVTQDLRRLNNLMVGVVIVVVALVVTLIFALGAVVTSSLADKQATSQHIRDEIHDQNAKIDALTKAIQNQQAAATPTIEPQGP